MHVRPTPLPSMPLAPPYASSVVASPPWKPPPPRQGQKKMWRLGTRRCCLSNSLPWPPTWREWTWSGITLIMYRARSGYKILYSDCWDHQVILLE